MRLIDADKLMDRINVAEENFKADYADEICAGGSSFTDGVMSALFNIKVMISQAETQEKIKHGDEE